MMPPRHRRRRIAASSGITTPTWHGRAGLEYSIVVTPHGASVAPLPTRRIAECRFTHLNPSTDPAEVVDESSGMGRPERATA